MPSVRTPALFLSCTCRSSGLSEMVLHEFSHYEIHLPHEIKMDDLEMAMDGLKKDSVLLCMYFRCPNCKKLKLLRVPLPEGARNANVTEDGKLNVPAETVKR